jgi:hypothetical protein
LGKEAGAIPTVTTTTTDGALVVTILEAWLGHNDPWNPTFRTHLIPFDEDLKKKRLKSKSGFKRSES